MELSSLKRVLAMLALPLSVAPVLLLGPSLLRAPVTLAHELEGDIAHLNPFAVQAAFADASPFRPLQAAFAVASPSRAPSPCRGMAPRGARVTRLSGPHVRLRWSAPSGHAPVGYRVLRSGHTIAQTKRTTMIVKVRLGRRTTFTIAARYNSAPRACPVELRSLLAVRAPGAVSKLRVLESNAAGARIGWSPAKRGDDPLAGYRIERDGTVAGQTHGHSYTLRLSAGRAHRVTVTAVDTAGHLGPASKTLTIESPRPAPPVVKTAHIPPDGPALLSAEQVTDTSATLSWQAGSAHGASLVGYVLFEDGVAEGVVHGQSTTVALASQRSYVFTVRALDSAGYMSEPAPDLTVLTTHTPPSTPSGLLAREVTDDSATLSWSPSTPVSGEIVGYRVFRDGIPVGQSSTPQMTLESLAPSTAYQVTVVAVDSLGAISAPTTPLEVQTAPPVQTHGHVQAFLLASTDQSFDDLQAHYQQIGAVYPTYFNCGESGEVTGVNDPLVTGWAQARGVAVMPRLNCQNPNEENQVLNEPAARQKMIEQLATLCATYGYQGVQIDFEGAQPSERNPFTAFITALAAKLHEQGEELSTIVTAKYYNIQSGRAAMYDDAALSEVSDYMFVLDWGLHWTTSGPGGMDELSWFTRVAEYTATLPNKSKFVLGMPMYGIDWPNGGGPTHPGTALEFNEITALESEFGVLAEWEPVAADPHFSYVDAGGVNHSVWFSDKQSIEVRVALAESLGLGVGLWHLGSEDQSIWELPGLGGSG